ncbi:hypothetical protein OSH11_13890 [Kaistia dalseonensis]|uniref:Uncharacterized protein n=1 Tax=Kaistia dalseonensis TaxID=410840 RepID=A0ABU0H8R5_9HYPH|nr:hypothetical protein [Kaistia dalseonensis]MCX5495801.1 hypothetical protein [Kaistia dalseonensis]MDQ0438402.1 hypothetical protein [Kaistia dalseonensis]
MIALGQMLQALFGSTKPRGDKARAIEAEVAVARENYQAAIDRVKRNSSILRDLVGETVDRVNGNGSHGVH